MSYFKGTPGPWEVGEDGDVIWGPEWKGRKTFVASVPFNKTPRTKADAHLIAAAPDLLSSHGRLLANFRLLLAGKPVRDVDEMYAEAEAAIAKATGEQP